MLFLNEKLYKVKRNHYILLTSIEFDTIIPFYILYYIKGKF